jgi:hypothetical protein
MPRPPDPARLEAIKVIREYVNESGPVEGPRRARMSFQNVPAATWHRWVRMTLDEDKRLIEKVAAVVPRLGRPPAPVDDDDRLTMRRAIDFFSEFDAMVADAQLLADYAVFKNDEGSRRVRNPQMLALSHRMRATNLALAMKYSEMAWSVERLEQMHDAIADAIHQADRETGERVFAAVKNIQRRWNLDRES